MTAVFAFSPILPASAAVLTGRRDIMSRQQPGQASNHEIRFITPTGVDSPTDTITLSFASSFNLSSIGFGDIDLFHGAITGFETTESIAAVAAAGVWGASISGDVITLTAPTDAVLGEIAASDIVFIRIGTNAVGGSNQIINPIGGGGGTQMLSIGGTFGDVGGLDIPFPTYPGDDFINISASFSTSAAPGGGGGSPGDITPPTIFNIQVLNITTSTALVTWQTNEPATTAIEWGPDVSYSLGDFSNLGLVVNHSVQLTGLPNATVIHFRLQAADAVNNTTQTGDQTFTTLAPGVPLVISNVQVTNITDTSALVTWDTNLPASSLVEYGTTVAYGGAATNGGLVLSHSVILTSLAPGTLYHFRVASAEFGGPTVYSPDGVFTTNPDLTPPTNPFNFFATPGNSLNNLTWVNPPEPDFSFVRIRARTDGFPLNPSDGRLVYEGFGEAFVDTGLVNGVTYFYANFAFDSSGNNSSGAYAQATPFSIPLPPTTTPPIPPPIVPPVVPPVTPPSGGGPTTTPPVVPPVTPPSGGGPTTTPPVVPPVTPPTRPGISLNPIYYAGAGSIELAPDARGTVSSAPGLPVLVRVPTTGLTETPVAGTIRVGGNTYALTPIPGGTAWGASFIPSNRVETVPAEVTFTFRDGSQARASNSIALLSGGRVLERSVNGSLQPIPDARVQIYEQIGGAWVLWNSGRFGQSNTVITGEGGGFRFLVPNGQYRIVAEKEGYVTQEKIIRVTQNVASTDIILPIEVPLPVIGPVVEFLQSETARETATIIAPVVVAIALANLALGASLFSLLNYIWFLLTQPVLLLGRKKRDKWGIVYNSLTKQPLDLAAVRLVHADTRLVVQTRVTDAKGRFIFQVRPGTYRLEAVKPGYVFPSVFLKDVKEDGDYVDVYHGENIVVKEVSEIGVNIPLDPNVKEETPRSIIIKRWLRKIQYAFSLVSVFITLAALIIAPSVLLAVLFIVQVLTFLLFLRLARPKKPKGWGVVYDSANRSPIGSTVVRIFDKKFNKLLETQVTSSKGEYGFFADKNVYFITAEKPGFEKYKSEDFDLTQKKDAIIDAHIPLKKK
ncbi:fibronectin type III domain-containing protein [Candidatus Uhrbacteria bacterium]|nr:fibronectin type III domain-containing protein [Candidatus Uhrbacteria bacterium]